MTAYDTLPTTVIPAEFGGQRTSKPNVLISQFGDGYTQRAKTGINNVDRTRTLNWVNITTEEKDELIDFFDDKDGSQAFYVAYPTAEGAELYIATEWDDTPADAGYWNVTAQLQKVFDLP